MRAIGVRDSANTLACGETPITICTRNIHESSAIPHEASSPLRCRVQPRLPHRDWCAPGTPCLQLEAGPNAAVWNRSIRSPAAQPEPIVHVSERLRSRADSDGGSRRSSQSHSPDRHTSASGKDDQAQRAVTVHAALTHGSAAAAAPRALCRRTEGARTRCARPTSDEERDERDTQRRHETAPKHHATQAENASHTCLTRRSRRSKHDDSEAHRKQQPHSSRMCQK